MNAAVCPVVVKKKGKYTKKKQNYYGVNYIVANLVCVVRRIALNRERNTLQPR